MSLDVHRTSLMLTEHHLMHIKHHPTLGD